MDRVINAGLILCLARTSFDAGPDCAKWVKAGHKPGSVHASEEGGWLSIWDRRCRRPRAAHTSGTGQMASPHS